jgi:hypothetical protein
VDLAAEWLDRLRPEAFGYARLALQNITREFPTVVSALMTAPGQFPSRPRDRTPVFYGSFDWHSCVEMHWVLVRLLRVAADAAPAAEIRSALDAQFTPQGLAQEAEYAQLSGTGLRQYGWGWALTLMHELATWPGDADARRWAAAMEPLASAVTANFLSWLPKATYPIRVGVHANSSFALSRALPYARMLADAGRPELARAIEQAAHRWYATDAGYPGGWEPSGHDFLSPALTEAELMARLLPAGEFGAWLGAFLPGLAAGEPRTCTASTSAGPGAGGGWPRPCPPGTCASRSAWPPRARTPRRPCRTWSPTTTWSPTGSPPTRSCCSADQRGDLAGQEGDKSLQVGIVPGGIDRDVGGASRGVLADRGRMPPTSSGGTTSGGQSRPTPSRCTYRPCVVTVCPCSSAYRAAVYSRSSVMGDSTLTPT